MIDTWYTFCCLRSDSPSTARSSDPRNPLRSTVFWFQASTAFADDMDARHVACDSRMGRLAQIAWLYCLMSSAESKRTRSCMLLYPFLASNSIVVPSRGQMPLKYNVATRRFRQLDSRPHQQGRRVAVVRPHTLSYYLLAPGHCSTVIRTTLGTNFA